MKSHKTSRTVIGLFVAVMMLSLPMTAMAAEVMVYTGDTGPATDPMCSGAAENWVAVTTGNALTWSDGDILSFNYRFETDEWMPGGNNDHAGIRVTGGGVAQTRIADATDVYDKPTPPLMRTTGIKTAYVRLSCGGASCTGDLEIYAANASGCWTDSALWVDDTTVSTSGTPATQRLVSVNDTSHKDENQPTTFTVSLDQASGSDIEISYTTVDGTATAPSDYDTTTGTVTIEDGDTSATFDVELNDNNDQPPNEYFTVVLTGVVSGPGTILDGTGVGWITKDDNAKPVWTASDPYEVWIDEFAPDGTLVALGDWYASDLDPLPPENTLTYTITGGDPKAGDLVDYAVAFEIDSATGDIRVKTSSEVDYSKLQTQTGDDFFELKDVDVEDALGQKINGKIWIHLNPITDIRAYNDNYHVAEGGTLTVSLPAAGLLGNDATDPPGGAMTVVELDGSPLASGMPVVISTGTLTLYSDGTFEFVHDGSDNMGSFGYTVEDGSSNQSTGWVNIWISPKVNDPPTVDDKTMTVAENSPVDTYVDWYTWMDPDMDWPNSEVSLAITSGNTGGAFRVEWGSVYVDNPAALDFETNPTFTLEVTATDGGQPPLSGTGTITVNLTDVNEAPTSSDSSVTTDEATTVTFQATDFPFSDVDTGNSLQEVRVISLPGKGTLRYMGVPAVLGQQVPVASIPSLTYTPVADENGPGYTSFMFRVYDGALYSTSNNTMTIDVTPVNDPPVFATVTDPVNASEGSPASVAIKITDVDSTTFDYWVDWNDNNVNDGGDEVLTGSSDLTPILTHTYTDDFGPATIDVTVTDVEGGDSLTDTDTTVVTITNVDPVADAGGAYTIDEGQGVTLNGSGTTDAGTGDIPGLGYAWDLDNDSLYDDATGVGPTVDWATLAGLGLASDGTVLTIGLQVTDDNGGAHTASSTLTINNLAPTVSHGGTYAIDEGQPLPLDASATTDPGGDGMTYAWDLDNDAAYDDATGASPSVLWATLFGLGLASDGSSLTIGVEVTDSDGDSATASTTLTIANLTPLANHGGAYTIDEGQDLDLDGSGSSDPGGDGISYAWELSGDALYDDATGATPTVPWATLAGFGLASDGSAISIGLEVTDPEPLTNVAITNLTINNLAPTANAGGPYTIDEGDDLVLAGSGSDPNPNETLTYSWDLNNDGTFGDAGFSADSGTVTWAQLGALAPPVNNDGSYNITLRVSDDVTSTDSTVTVTITNVAPTANAGGPYTINEGDDLVLSGSGGDANANDTLTYEWDLNGDADFTDATGASPTVTWAQLQALGIDNEGSGTMTLRVSDDDTSTTDSTTGTMLNVAPTADANTGVAYSISEGDDLVLAGSGSDVNANDTLTYTWDLNGDNIFGDAGITAPTGTVTWAQLAALGLNDTGSPYNVVLRVFDGVDTTDSAAEPLTVANTAPSADANTGAAYSISEGDDLVLAGAAGDVNPNDALTYTWDINGDNIFGDAGISAATGTVTWAQLMALGINDIGSPYNVVLRVSDGTDTTDSPAEPLTVANVAPSADANTGAAYSISEGDDLVLAGAAVDVNTNDALTYTWDINGDGIFGDAGISAATGTVTWAQLMALGINDTGSPFSVVLRVSDGTDTTDSPSVPLTVANVAPSADANTGAAYGISEGDDLVLAGSGSDVNTNDALTITWDINGDGTFGDAGFTAAAGTVTWAQLDALGINDTGSPYNVVVRVSDGTDTVDSPVETLTVANTAPSADANTGAAYSISEGDDLVLAGSGSDPNSNDTLTYTWDINGDGTFGDAGITAATGTVTWAQLIALGINDTGSPYNVVLRVFDGVDTTDSAAEPLTVVNAAPSADANTGAAYSISEGDDLVLAGSGSDANTNDTLTYTWDINGDGTFGDAGISATTGTVTWAQMMALGINDIGSPFNVVLRVSDGTDTTDSVAEPLTVANVAPSADANTGAAYSINEGDDLVLAGDAGDVNTNDALTYTWDINGDGTFGDAGFTAATGTVTWAQLIALGINDTGSPYNVVLRVSDGTDTTDSPAEPLTVANTAPAADANTGAAYSIDEGDDLVLAGAAGDVNTNDALTITWDINGDGTFGDAGFTAATGTVTWAQLDALGINDTGSPYNVIVRVSDGTDTTDSPAEPLTVANTAPTADANTGAAYSIDEGDDLVLSGSGSDVNSNDTLTYSWDINGDGTFGDAGFTAATGTVTWAQLEALAPPINNDGSYNVTLRVSDGTNSTDSAVEVLTVANVAPAADANTGAAYSINEGDDLVLSGSGSDVITADSLTYAWDLNNDGIFGDAGLAAATGTVTWAQLQALVPPVNDEGSYTITLRVSDDDTYTDDTAPVTIANVAPTGNDDSGAAFTTDEDTGTTLDVLANDTDANSSDNLLVQSPIDTATFSTKGLVVNNGLNISYLPNGQFEALNVGDSVTDRFIYTVSDGDGGTDTATVTVTIDGVNDAPTFSGFSGLLDSVNEDTQVEITFADIAAQGDEADVDGTVDAFVVKSVSSGTLLIGSSAASATPFAATTNDQIGGTVEAYWTPDPDANGAKEAFRVVALDDSNAESAFVIPGYVLVNPVGDITVDTATTAEDTLVNIDVLANDSFAGAAVVSVAPGDEPANGSAVVQGDNTINYTPNNDWHGSDVFTYTVTSGGATETATVTVTVNAVADVVLDAFFISEDLTVNIDVTGNDTFAGSATVIAVTQGANGSVVIEADNTVTYTPIADWNGNDSFTYTVSNGGADEIGTVNIAAAAVADIAADAAIAARNTPWTIDLMANDSFENAGATITSFVTNPTANGGTIVDNGDGTVTYTSAPLFTGVDTFDYIVTSGGVTETATVTVTVENVYSVTINWTGTGDGTVVVSGVTIAPESPFNTYTPKSATGDITGPHLTVLVKEDDVISLTATPVAAQGIHGSRFEAWGDGETTATHTDMTVTTDVTLTVEFAQQWQIASSVTGEDTHITVTTVDNPNPNPRNPAGSANPEILDEGGDSDTYDYTPDEGYFVNLIVTVPPAAPVAEATSSFPVSKQVTTITADQTIEANVLINPEVTATVLLSDEDNAIHGSVTPAGTTSYYYGETPAYTISADDGWCVESVTVDGAEVWDNTGTTNYTINSASDHTYQFDPLTRAGTDDYEITAVFRQPWVFTGTISPFMAQAVWQGAGSWSLYDEDQDVFVAQNMDHLNTVTLPCDSRNFTFYVHDQSDWETVETGGTRDGADVKFAFSVTDDSSKDAQYRPILTLLIDGNGTTTPATAMAYDFQTTATVTASPNDPANYVFTNWRGDADGTVATTDVYMDEPKTVTAVFSSKTDLDVDDDGDGKTENQGDCDDGDAGRAPNIEEIAGDGIDQDCNGVDLAAGLGTVCLPISDVPLDTELQAAPANIMFILDDSGSMNWEFMTPESEGKFDSDEYLFDGHSSSDTLDGDDRQQWQSQWHEYNKMYYNPAVTYDPWPNKAALHDPDDPLRFPGTTSTATTDLSDTFYDLNIAGQGGSEVSSTDIIVDDLDQAAAAGETVIIDDGGAGFSMNPGWAWNWSNYRSDKYGGSYRYTDRNSSQQSGWTATWDFGTPGHSAGTYDVFVWWPESNTYWSDRADYKVYNGGTEVDAFTTINQKTNGGQWNYLGRYAFGADSARVVLTHDTGSNPGTDDNRVVADAARIVKVTAASTVRRFEILSGTWYEQTNHGESYNDPTNGRHFYDTRTGNDDNVFHEARWYPYVDDGDPDHGPGLYQIYAWWRDYNDYSNPMWYQICIGGTCTDTRNLNQTDSGNASGQWNLLETPGSDTFAFTGASPENEYVRLFWRPDDHNDKDVNADAIAFVKQGAGPTSVTMANSHYYVRGTDDNIYLVNLTGNVGSGTLQRRFYLFATADKADPRDTVDVGDLTEVTDVATLQSLGLLRTDDVIANITGDVTAGDTTLNVTGLSTAIDAGAYVTIEGAPGTFYEVTASTISTITTATALPAVTAPKGITLYRSPEQERRNFANWFSFYRARHLAAKAAVGTAISQIRGVQIGLFTIQERLTQPVLKVKVGGYPDQTNTLLNALYGLSNGGGTPLRQALRNVGRYFDNDDTYDGNIEGDDATLTGDPWFPADQGGSCQQSFAILMSDGFWNGGSPGVGDVDSNKGAPYQDHPTIPATSFSNTLADVAYNFWNTDLVDDLDNDVPTNYRDSNNRQHMVTYTVAFGVQGTLNPADYDLFNAVSPTYPIWPDPTTSCSSCTKKIDDMWHASVNGRGIFLSAEDPTALVTNLTDVIQNVIARIGSGASVSINGEELHAGTVMFQSSYSSDGWTGDVKGYEVVTPYNQQTGEKIGDIRFDKPLWSASYKLGDILPKPNPDWPVDPSWDKTSWDTGRVIATYDSGAETGKKFRYSHLTTNQKAYLPGATATEITEKVNYLRGDNTLEEDKVGGRFRRRFSKIGDIVHSSPLYQGYIDGGGDPYGVIYVGANDGMLHAFYAGKTNGDAADQALRGKELFAFVPNHVFPKLNDLTRPASTHQFYVDGTPFVRDTGTQKVLIGGLGRGGKGVYALDVTDPLTHTEDNAASWVLWEYPRDNTSQAQKDQLGYTYARPFMVQSNDADIGWVALVGNGYDSKDQCPALFIMNVHEKIEGGVTIPAGSAVEIIKASNTATCTGDCNGLSEPLPVDVDGNTTVDYVYAGDLRGNIWKFDMTSDDHTEWRVFHETASGDVAPFFTAKGPGNKIQPITITPSLMKHPESDKPGFMIVFGTGKYMHTDDMDPPTDPSYSTIQTIYGVWDYGDAFVSPDPSHPLKDRREYLGTMQRSGSGATETNTLSNVDTDISLQKQVEDFYQEVHFFTCPPENAGDDPTTVSTTDVNDPAVSGCTEEFSRYLRVLSQEPINWKTGTDGDPGQLDNPVTNEANHAGWYFDLPHATDRERVIRNGLIRDGKYVVITSIPRSSPCSAGGDSILHEMDAATGGRLDTAQFDIDLDAAITAGDLIVIQDPKWSPGDPIEDKFITVAPTGIHFRKMMYPPVILRLPDQITEMKYFSTAAGNISMVQEVAEQRGMFYWRER